MVRVGVIAALSALFAFFALAGVEAGTDLQGEAADAIEAAVKFSRTHIACRGGYLWKYSEDMEQWFGEARATPSQVWVQPPGTPSVGLVYLRAYEITGDERYLEAATAAADALIWGQLVPGGWEYRIDFLGESTWQYRHEGDDSSGRNRCTFDDDTSQSATRLLMAVDDMLNRDPYSQAASYALEFMLESQFPNGAWPQWYPLSGNYPEEYTDYYTFNDGATNDCIDVMMEAYVRYGDERYLGSAKRGGDFIILSQMDPPQAGWAQQYYWNMTPAWGRDFEPPAVCSKVTGRNIRTLLDLYLFTGNETYLEPIPAAISWFSESKIGKDLWARFYELGTNLPIYCDVERKITYDLSEVELEYSWTGSYGSNPTAMYDEVISKGREQYLADRNRELGETERSQKAEALEPRIREILDALDDRARWIEDGWIYTKTFNQNLDYLLSYLEYSGWNETTEAVPRFGSFSVSATGDKMVLAVRVTHPEGQELISSVVLRFTPPTFTAELALHDDGKEGDAVEGDGVHTLTFEPRTEVSLAVYQGVVVAEDVHGHWNLTLLPLGVIAEAAKGLRDLQANLVEALEIQADPSYLIPSLTRIEGDLSNISDTSNPEELLTEVMNLTSQLEVLVVSKLIEMASEAIAQAKETGIDTSRQEIFLRKAREEFDEGNYGPARQWTEYPLRLRESIAEFSILSLTSLLGLLVLRKFVVNSGAVLPQSLQ